MCLGKFVESGDAQAVALDPAHPYTKALFAAALPIDLDGPREEIAVLGEVPKPARTPVRVPLSSAPPFATPRCATEEPALRTERGWLVACHLY